jgi:hypothetical protein
VGTLLGLAGVLVLPGAIEITRASRRFELLDAAYAVPGAFLLGLVALILSRRARRALEWRVARRGERVARVAFVLGVLALCLALAAGIAIGLYGLALLREQQ